MTRDAMRQLKANTEETDRLQRIKQIVNQIYQAAFQTAKSKSDTSYYHRLPQATTVAETQMLGPKVTTTKYGCNRGSMNTDPFYLKNMPDILAGLQELFPGCDVSQTQFSMGADGKMYDISKIDEKVLPFVNSAYNQSCIVIDWS